MTQMKRIQIRDHKEHINLTKSWKIKRHKFFDKSNKENTNRLLVRSSAMMLADILLDFNSNLYHSRQFRIQLSSYLFSWSKRGPPQISFHHPIIFGDNSCLFIFSERNRVKVSIIGL